MVRVNVKVARLLIAAGAVFLYCACASPPEGTFIDAASVVASPNPWPVPLNAAPDDPPRILALWMNETSIPSGSTWSGRIITTTNVASVEIRTESFSFVADRTGYGDFRFTQHVLDMVPFYKRSYVLEVIARNAAGKEDARLVRVQFQ